MVTASLLAPSLALLLAAPEEQTVTLTRPAMGLRFEIVLVGVDEALGPVDHGTHGATVLAATCAEAEMLSTTVLGLGAAED